MNADGIPLRTCMWTTGLNRCLDSKMQKHHQYDTGITHFIIPSSQTTVHQLRCGHAHIVNNGRETEKQRKHKEKKERKKNSAWMKINSFESEVLVFPKGLSHFAGKLRNG